MYSCEGIIPFPSKRSFERQVSGHFLEHWCMRATGSVCT